MRFLKIFTIVIFLAPCAITIRAEETVFVDKGACPGERCTYGVPFTAHSEFDIYESASRCSVKIGTVSTGEVFFSRTGEVHTVPTRVEILKESGVFKPGDELLVLTYEGLGFYRARHNGNLIDGFELGFDPWGDNPVIGCEREDEYCWVGFLERIKSIWWINIQLENGTEGWIAYRDSFAEILED
jgi:hypothetical protein